MQDKDQVELFETFTVEEIVERRELFGGWDIWYFSEDLSYWSSDVS